jgi:hypothetical protein
VEGSNYGLIYVTVLAFIKENEKRITIVGVPDKIRKELSM